MEGTGGMFVVTGDSTAGGTDDVRKTGWDVILDRAAFVDANVA
jgi:hypothetical protein